MRTNAVFLPVKVSKVLIHCYTVWLKDQKNSHYFNDVMDDIHFLTYI